ncbi:MAG: hypothetical protein MUE71_01500 [Chitinophagaceae bacterium]|nr:hypothetical protein [Chitinophagaceae bacterium]
MKTLKSWGTKMEKPSKPEVKNLEHAFADLKEHSKMLIPTPKLIEAYLKQSEHGQKVDLKQMRADLAADNHADGTCPLTTGIFLRILSEFTNERKEAGDPINQLAPIWRILNPKMPLWKKLSFDKTWILELQQQENLKF